MRRVGRVSQSDGCYVFNTSPSEWRRTRNRPCWLLLDDRPVLVWGARKGAVQLSGVIGPLHFHVTLMCTLCTRLCTPAEVFRCSCRLCDLSVSSSWLGEDPDGDRRRHGTNRTLCWRDSYGRLLFIALSPFVFPFTQEANLCFSWKTVPECWQKFWPRNDI